MAQSEYNVIVEAVTSILVESNLGNTIVVSFLTILILLFSHYIGNWFEKRKENERRKIWLRFLKSYNNPIDACLKDFVSYRSPDFWPGLVGGISGIFLSVVLWVILLYALGDVTSALVYSTFINAIPFLMSSLIRRYISKSKLHTEKLLNNNENEDNVGEWLHKSKRIVNATDLLQMFAVGTLWWIVFVVSIVYGGKNVQISENMRYVLVFSGYMGFMAFIASISNHRNMRGLLKLLLNVKYLDKYPYVQIKTEFGNLEGYIADLFDERLIVLRKDDKISVAEWNSIVTVELIKKDRQHDKKLPENK
ncbi:hypothetical protein [Geoglobus acetivorans]|uniref:Uncharacterized protein n=1 Tax=Geoglobus acetivorans TaxID=565033 RepID=A0A0A7GDJ2_GEOAI|nr:hypothetical protein GACE_0839 [Geoglobus acetivorans]